MYNLQYINKQEDLFPQFHRIRPWLDKALEHNEDGLTWHDVYKQLDERDMYLFVTDNAFAIVSFHTVGWRKVFIYQLVGGETGHMHEILDNQAATEAFARKYDHLNIAMICRPVWGRIMKQYGFEKETYMGRTYFMKRLEANTK